jgi:hypothetical protein
MVRRECFTADIKFDEEPGVYGEDWMVWMQIAAQWPVYFLEDALVCRRLYPESFSAKNAEAQFQNLFRNLEKLQKSIPALAADPGLVRNAAHTISWKRGWEDILRLEVAAAKSKLERAVRYKRFSLRAWALLLVANFPVGFLQLVRDRVRGLRKFTRWNLV